MLCQATSRQTPASLEASTLAVHLEQGNVGTLPFGLLISLMCQDFAVSV